VTAHHFAAVCQGITVALRLEPAEGDDTAEARLGERRRVTHCPVCGQTHGVMRVSAETYARLVGDES